MPGPWKSGRRGRCAPLLAFCHPDCRHVAAAKESVELETRHQEGTQTYLQPLLWGYLAGDDADPLWRVRAQVREECTLLSSAARRCTDRNRTRGRDSGPAAIDDMIDRIRLAVVWMHLMTGCRSETVYFDVVNDSANAIQDEATEFCLPADLSSAGEDTCHRWCAPATAATMCRMII